MKITMKNYGHLIKMPWTFVYVIKFWSSVFMDPNVKFWLFSHFHPMVLSLSKCKFYGNFIFIQWYISKCKLCAPMFCSSWLNPCSYWIKWPTFSVFTIHIMGERKKTLPKWSFKENYMMSPYTSSKSCFCNNLPCCAIVNKGCM
jgi:hypothetical protein